MIRDDNGFGPLAANLDLHPVALAEVAVEHGQTDRPHRLFIRYPAGKPFALDFPVRDHCSAGNESDALVCDKNLCRRAGDAPARKGHWNNTPRKVRYQRIIFSQDFFVGLILPRKGVFTDKIAFQRRETNSEPGKRAGEDGYFLSVRILPKFVPVERQGRLKPERVPRAKPHRCCAPLDQQVPYRRGGLAGDEQFKAYRFARVSCSGNPGLNTIDDNGGQFVPHRLRQGARINDAAQYLPCQRALKRDHRQFFGFIRHFHIVKAGQVFGKVVPVLPVVCGIDNEEIFALDEAVEVCIIDRPASGVGNHGVLGLSDVQRLGVVAEDVL